MKYIKNFIAFLVLFVAISCKNDPKKEIPFESKTEEPTVVKKTATEIAESFKPINSEIAHPVIETKVWGKKNVIIAFYESRYIDNENTTSPQERQYIEGFLLVPDTKNNYKKILIDRFEDDNVDTIITSVFFANADKDKEKELIILTCCSHRLQLIYDGTEYSTNVFDNFDMNKPPKKMNYLSDISGTLQGGFEGEREDGPSKANFKTASEVKVELKRLGF